MERIYTSPRARDFDLLTKSQIWSLGFIIVFICSFILPTVEGGLDSVRIPALGEQEQIGIEINEVKSDLDWRTSNSDHKSGESVQNVKYGNDRVSTMAWRSEERLGYPETPMLDKLKKANSGIAVSGGGLRSYFSTLGYYRALLDLGILNRTRYMSCVSGGCWATASYVYHSSQVALTPEHFLGPLYQPEDLNRHHLRTIETGCGRKVPTKLDVLLAALFNLFYEEYNPLDVWYRTIAEVFLRPAGIKRNALFSWNRSVVAEAVARNPYLIDHDFVLPCDGEDRCDHRPYPIINSAILGPEGSAPFGLFNMKFTGLESTPLYVGSAQVHQVKYPPASPILATNIEKENNERILFGGFVQPFAFGGTTYDNNLDNSTVSKPFFGLEGNNTHGILLAPRPKTPYTLANATGTSSWAPGSILSAESVVNNILNKFIGLRASYWSPQPRKDPQEAIFSSDILLADGGSIENQGLLPLLRRRVKNIVVFITTNVPLKPRKQYNPFTRIFPRDSDIDSSFSSFFGHTDWIPAPGYDFYHNQVFSRLDFPWVVDKLQKAQSKGRGTVAKTKLTTVRNSWWGIPRGHRVNIAWVYLGRVREWEKRLPEYLQKNLVPAENEDDPTNLINFGPYKNFPHIATSDLNYSPEQANLLANMAGWVVQQNAHIFTELLS